MNRLHYKEAIRRLAYLNMWYDDIKDVCNFNNIPLNQLLRYNDTLCVASLDESQWGFVLGRAS